MDQLTLSQLEGHLWESANILDSHKNSDQESEWSIAPLGEIADVMYGPIENRTRGKMTMEQPYLRVANVHRDSIKL